MKIFKKKLAPYLKEKEKRALVLLAHGSRKKTSNQEVIAFTKKLQGEGEVTFDYYGTGFLELAEPDIPTSIEKAIGSGATEIIIFPYFLASGSHVLEDIPEIVHAKIKELKDRLGASCPKILLTSHLGGADLLPKAVMKMLKSEIKA